MALCCTLTAILHPSMSQRHPWSPACKPNRLLGCALDAGEQQCERPCHLASTSSSQVKPDWGASAGSGFNSGSAVSGSETGTLPNSLAFAAPSPYRREG